MLIVPVAAIGLAGVLHLIMAPGQFSDAFPHAVFFMLIGAAQLLWSLAFWRYTSPILYWAGLAASGGTINVWFLTQLVSVPYAPTAHVIDPLAVVIISGELIGFVTLMGLMRPGQPGTHTGRPVARLIGGALVIALVFGTGVWGGGHLAEVIALEEARVQLDEPGLGHGHSDRPNIEDAHDAKQN